ncbi:MAG: hypothetical protein KME06_02400 [Kastovskya adunca ATA6-11-RM4]|nr:hypothetical protein [Kastovskya adunca ATA6-11-RM4]
MNCYHYAMRSPSARSTPYRLAGNISDRFGISFLVECDRLQKILQLKKKILLLSLPRFFGIGCAWR